MGETGDHAAKDVENEKTAVAHPVFHVVAEDPEEPHVADDVEPSSMDEKAREERPPVVHGDPQGPGPFGMGETGRDDPEEDEEFLEAVRGKAQFQEEDQGVGRDQGPHNVRGIPAGILVSKGNQGASFAKE